MVRALTSKVESKMPINLPADLAAKTADIALGAPRAALVETIRNLLPRCKVTTKPQTGLYEYGIKSIYSQDTEIEAQIKKSMEIPPTFTDAKRQITVEWKVTPKRYIPDKKLRTKKPKGA